MKMGLLVLSSVALFLLSAKAHGRELRIEREIMGFHHVVFGGPDNPPFVEALWHRERVYFWPISAALALAVGARLVTMDLSKGFIALVVLTWVPSVSFVGLGLWSLARKGLTAEGIGGSVVWWSLVLAAVASTVLLGRGHLRAS